MIDLDARVGKIKSTGYWRVALQPTQFDEKLVPTLAECRRVIETSKVVLRGWDYPHVDDKEQSHDGDWIQSGIDWPEYGHVEIWRFYKSGQFVHYFAGLEDYHELPWSSSHGKPDRYLLYASAVYTISEVFEFASRLSAKDILQPSTIISIRLGNMAGRELAGWDHQDMVPRGYTCEREEIEFKRTIEAESLLAEAADLALDASIELLERFGRFEPTHQLLAEYQRNLLDRRAR